MRVRAVSLAPILGDCDKVAGGFSLYKNLGVEHGCVAEVGAVLPGEHPKGKLRLVHLRLGSAPVLPLLTHTIGAMILVGEPMLLQNS